MSYISNTDSDRKKMLERIGVNSFDDLIKAIPEKLKMNRPLDIPAYSEMELLSLIRETASRNLTDYACFAGGGVYDHFIPSAVNTIINRPEFLTAYTPYQPEVSQGTLQVIYEFQTHICRLTGMDVANASMYDGASAAAEAILMACAVTKRDKVIISETVSPLWRDVINSYLTPRGFDLVLLPHRDGETDMTRLADIADEKTACLLISQPNFFGIIEDADSASELIHKVGGKFIMGVDPISQTLLKTPADYDADIVIGEGQPLGIPLSYGGPLLGFMAAKRELIRSLPGRIAARTKDIEGKTGFVLTLQTREQHIRRQKATSNICTNQALCATAASVYISLMGKEGLKKVALLSAEKAQKLSSLITDIEGFELYFKGPYVREFAIKTPVPASELITTLLKDDLLAGINGGGWFKGMDNCLIVALTEKRTDTEINRLVNCLKELATSEALSRMQN